METRLQLMQVDCQPQQVSEIFQRKKGLEPGAKTELVSLENGVSAVPIPNEEEKDVRLGELEEPAAMEVPKRFTMN